MAREGTVTASKGKYAITAGPGFGAHNYVAGKFGSQGRSQDCYTVYFTDFTTALSIQYHFVRFQPPIKVK